MNDLLLHRIRREHQRMSAIVDRESRLRFPDDARLGEHKRRKLMLKDRLRSLEQAGDISH